MEPNQFVMMIFDLAIILFAVKIAGDISVRLGQPSVLGKLVVGILLGPSFLGILDLHEAEYLEIFSELGVLLLMFIAGLETDVDEFKRSAKASTSVGILGIALPLSMGYITGISLLDMSTSEALFLGLLLSATSVSISVQALKEIGKLKSREGATILGAAVIDDVVVIVLLAFLMSIMGGDAHLGLLILKKVAFFGVAILAAWKFLPIFANQFIKLKITQALTTSAIILCIVFAYVAELAGVAGIIGAYIAGIGFALTKHQHKLAESVETIGYSIFIPVFFVSIGLKIDVASLEDSVGTIILVSIIAILTKLVGGALGAKLTGFDNRSSLGIGSAMISRGEVALIIAQIGLTNKLLDQEMFSDVVGVVLITTLVTPPLLKYFLSKQKVNVSASPDSGKNISG